ncbi:MAG: DUF4445 domain-containing protein [Oscillospiraceae bacterium]|nr:DUF4445 domain-containing protein [Oscillospiraceae bacterium]
MKILFQMENAAAVAVDGQPGENLLELARRANVPMDAPCSGNGSCGKCRVKLLSGELEALPSRHITEEEFNLGWRLSCCCRVVGDCTVLVPDTASAYRSRIKTAGSTEAEELSVFPGFLSGIGLAPDHPFLAPVVTMDPPSAADTAPDSERLERAVKQATGAETVRIPYPVMKKLAAVLRQNGFRVCVKGMLESGCFVCMDITHPGDTALAAAAVDIGTTTVSAAVCDLATGAVTAKGSAGNGQIRFGADVINRIIEAGKPGGRERLQSAIVEETLNPLLGALCKEAGIGENSLLRLAVGANTTMNHLLLGVDAQSIRMEPYIPGFFAWDGLTAGDIGLTANPLAPVVLAPNIGSYVGGDITAGILAARLWDSEELCLFIDLGTNGEIVFGNRDFLMGCACSAGPAFEGGDLSCGMRATDGAIEAVTIDAAMEPKLTVVGKPGQRPAGICGSGIIDAIAQLFRHGIINQRGQFVKEGSRIRRDRYGMGRYVLCEAADSATGREISINEVDMDNFIRAKGAIFSAIDVLLQSVGMTAQCIHRIYVAGGIGSGINMENAVAIGMLPDVQREKFRYIGNACLTGAYAMAVCDPAAALCRRVAANMTYLELSTHPGYMDAFVAACFLPHTNRALFPNQASPV